MNILPAPKDKDFADMVITTEATQIANKIFIDKGVAIPVDYTLQEKVKFKLLEMN